MNIKEIEQLLDKYYEGETTLAEESILKEFFRTGNIPPHLAEHAPLFVWADQTAGGEIPDFDINLPESTDEETKIIPLYRRRPLMWIAGIAATVIILAGFYLTLRMEQQKNISETEAKIAYQQTKEALMMLSVNLNTGLDKVQKLQSLGDGLQGVQEFSKFYKYQTIIINPDEAKSPQNILQ